MVIEFSVITSFFIYYFCIFLSTSFVYVGNKIKNRFINKIFFLLAMFLMSTIYGMRYYVGTDYATYEYLFNDIRLNNWSYLHNESLKTFEIGFRYLSKLLSDIGNNQVVFFSICMINFILFFYAMKKMGIKHVALAYYIYINLIYISSMNIVRQMIAVNILLVAIGYLLQNNIKMAIICNTIAILFHKSAWVFVFVIFLWLVQKNNLFKKHTFFVYFVGGVFLLTWQKILIAIPYFNKYIYLLNGSQHENRDIFLNLLYVVIFLILKGKMSVRDNNFSFFYYMLITAFIINFTGFYTPFLKRLGIYFSISLIPLMSSLIDIFDKKSQKFVYIIIGLAYVLLFIVTTIILNQGDIVPYRIIIGG